MQYTEFRDEVKNTIEKLMKDKCSSVVIKKVIKPNDIEKEFISTDDEDVLMIPAVYLDDLYRMHERGMDVNEAVDVILDIIRESRKNDLPDIPDLFDLSTIKNMITFKLLNKELNRRYLENTVHIDFLDLSVVFYVTLFCSDNDQFASKVTTDQFDQWGIKKDELFKLAKDNTKRLGGLYLKEIKDAICDLGAASMFHGGADHYIDPPKAPVLVLSNRQRCHGAASILMDGVMKNVSSRLGGDILIIPSSIHEVMLMPEGSIDADAVCGIIKDVNRKVLSPEDVLSEHVYYYRREEGMIVM